MKLADLIKSHPAMQDRAIECGWTENYQEDQKWFVRFPAWIAQVLDDVGDWRGRLQLKTERYL